MNPLEQYLDRVRRTLAHAESFVSAEGLAEVRRLVDHGEPADGMCLLAWAIVNEDARVPTRLIREVEELAGDIVPREHMPSTLAQHGMDDGE